VLLFFLGKVRDYFVSRDCSNDCYNPEC